MQGSARSSLVSIFAVFGLTLDSVNAVLDFRSHIGTKFSALTKGSDLAAFYQTLDRREINQLVSPAALFKDTLSVLYL